MYTLPAGPATQEDLAPYTQRLDRCIRLMRSLSATLRQLCARDSDRRRAHPAQWGVYTAPADTAAISAAYDQVCKQAAAAAATLYACGQLSAADFVTILAGNV